MSFKKRSVRENALPPGTRISTSAPVLLVSTGVSSLDRCIHGGIPVGSLVMLKEDQHTSYAKLLQSHFISQGIASQNALAVVSAYPHPKELIEQCPSISDLDAPTSKINSPPQQEMKIAWRYQHQKKTPSSLSDSVHATSKYCTSFDVSTPIDKKVVDQVSRSSLLISPHDVEEHHFDYILTKIREKIENEGLSTYLGQKPTSTNILRIVIHSIGSVDWPSFSSQSFFRFLVQLKILLRFSLSCCFLTIPAYLYEKPRENKSFSSFFRSIEHCADILLEIDSFAGTPRSSNAAFNQYHGFFYIHKHPRLNTIATGINPTLLASGGASGDLAFKLGRKKFTIEPYHLPPELGNEVKRGGEEHLSTKKDKKKAISCGSNNSTGILDF